MERAAGLIDGGVDLEPLPLDASRGHVDAVAALLKEAHSGERLARRLCRHERSGASMKAQG